MVQAIENAEEKDSPQPLQEGQSAHTPEEARDNFPPGTRVKVIVNPASGKKGGIITTNVAGVNEVRQVLEANGIQADIVETEHEGHATELAKQAVKDGYQIVIGCGGDGTVAETAKGLIGTKAALGILPLGSANNVARMMHVPFDLAEAGKLLRVGEIKKVDVGRCNGTYFFEIAGIGLDAALFPILNHVDKGEYVRLIDAARTMIKFRPRSVTLMLDGRAVRVRALVVLVANGPYWGYSVPLAPDARVDDGRFDVVVFRNFSKADFIRHVIGSLLGRAKLEHAAERKQVGYTHHPKIKTYHAKRVQVLTSRRRPWPVHADALPRGYTPALVECIPASLSVITGSYEL